MYTFAYKVFPKYYTFIFNINILRGLVKDTIATIMGIIGLIVMFFVIF